MPPLVNDGMKCVDCEVRAPEADSEFTLIRGGWRLTRRYVGESILLDWRCPACWQVVKDKALTQATDALLRSREAPSTSGAPR